MPRRAETLPPSVMPLAQRGDRPLRWRLHSGLKSAILSGQFPPGSRLPSTRSLAASLAVSRSTVMEAFDQLAAEGFIDRRRGSGSYVRADLTIRPGATPEDAGRRVRRVARAADVPDDAPQPVPFTPCEPDATMFPHRLWARLLARYARAPLQVSQHVDPAGLLQLRQAVATHLALARGVVADAEQVIIVGGARQAVDLCTRTLLRPGDEVWCEDPGYPAARASFTFGGMRPVPVPVDGDGMDVDAATRVAPHARAAYVTPSHQFPTGALMGLGRRLRLLDWAAHHDMWILEDDYDSEFCYDNRPLPALQGIDGHGSVVYLGTLNKVTYPGLRLGYVVAPASVRDTLVAAAAMMSLSPPAIVQGAFAEFMSDGHLAQHITRMRAVYRDRQGLLIGELDKRLGDRVSVAAARVGMNLLVDLRELDAFDVARRGAGRGLDLRTLTSYAQAHQPRNALVIGYTHLTPEMIKPAANELAQLLVTS